MTASRRAGLSATALLLIAGVGAFVLNRRVDTALEKRTSIEQPVEFVAVPERTPLPLWTSDDTEDVVAIPGGLYIAGGFGVARLETPTDSSSGGLDRKDISMALPSRRATALSAWRTDVVAGLDSGGLFVYREGSWSEIRTGYGTLHVRNLAESAAGELWIGAREGLFRIGLAERTMARLHQSPVRAIAVADGGRVISGGEAGLFVTQAGRTSSLSIEGAEAAWIEDVAFFGGRIHAITPIGLFREGTDGVLRPVANGENVASMAVQGDHLFATSDPADTSLRRFDGVGRVQSEQLPSAVRRVFTVGERLVADTERGLVERSNETWRILSPRRQQGGFGNAHVGALAEYRGRLIVGFFDGGLAELVTVATPTTMAMTRKTIDEAMLRLRGIVDPTSKAVWAVNALLDAGGVLHVASLRGAFRFDGAHFTPLEGSGAAFSLAQTTGGVAVGYGEGVLLPEHKLLSGFHGLPGNQATALGAAEGGLLVGTPSGLGYVEGRTVRWRVGSGEGKLPHPWVTAILAQGGSVLVGTYGGGVVRRVGSMSDPGAWKPFPETEGLKINTGCLVKANGRVYAGTDGLGVFRLSVDGTRFERLKLSVPSMRITALFEKDGFLYIGTDEGLTRWPVERDAPQ